ncbi:hypothetical protein DM02DRAFT_410793 [Periconia macrospinosa]|uniref:Uncharacterized protein n=1 Tax=Periconia macrospinosa TaxID=97972 RepID=A0A2V1DPG1_9PLEO|nr:hypothetical protein DM02DRAFT_410793 [Periconia macrospinosa]
MMGNASRLAAQGYSTCSSSSGHGKPHHVTMPDAPTQMTRNTNRINAAQRIMSCSISNLTALGRSRWSPLGIVHHINSTTLAPFFRFGNAMPVCSCLAFLPLINALLIYPHI